MGKTTGLCGPDGIGQVRPGGKVNRVFGVVFLLLSLAACVGGFVDFPVTPEGQQELESDITIVRLSQENIGNLGRRPEFHNHTTLPQRRGWDYQVGVGDLLTIVIFDHPELTIPVGTAQVPNGFRVQSDGTLYYPFIGQIHASGRSPGEIRTEMAQKLREYFPDPQVELRVAAFNSQSISIAGEVRLPKRIPLTTIRMNLLEAINAAGGMGPLADAGHIHIKRGGHVYDVDLDAFLRGAADENNPLLQNEDVVYVNRRETQEAYLMGEVGRVTVVNVAEDTVTLTQSLARVGGLIGQRADARGIFVFRNRPDGSYVYQLDISNPEGLLLGTRFVLAPDDVVYVVRAPLARWQDVLSALMPSLGAVRATQAITAP